MDLKLQQNNFKIEDYDEEEDFDSENYVPRFSNYKGKSKKEVRKRIKPLKVRNGSGAFPKRKVSARVAPYSKPAAKKGFWDDSLHIIDLVAEEEEVVPQNLFICLFLIIIA